MALPHLQTSRIILLRTEVIFVRVVINEVVISLVSNEAFHQVFVRVLGTVVVLAVVIFLQLLCEEHHHELLCWDIRLYLEFEIVREAIEGIHLVNVAG